MPLVSFTIPGQSLCRVEPSSGAVPTASVSDYMNGVIWGSSVGMGAMNKVVVGLLAVITFVEQKNVLVKYGWYISNVRHMQATQHNNALDSNAAYEAKTRVMFKESAHTDI